MQIERASRSIGERHHGALCPAHYEIASDGDVAKERASKGCGIARHAEDSDAVARIALHADGLIRNSNHAAAHGRLAQNASA
jgi:hypothetical protein